MAAARKETCNPCHFANRLVRVSDGMEKHRELVCLATAALMVSSETQEGLPVFDSVYHSIGTGRHQDYHTKRCGVYMHNITTM